MPICIYDCKKLLFGFSSPQRAKLFNTLSSVETVEALTAQLLGWHLSACGAAIIFYTQVFIFRYKTSSPFSVLPECFAFTRLLLVYRSIYLLNFMLSLIFLCAKHMVGTVTRVYSVSLFINETRGHRRARQ